MERTASLREFSPAGPGRARWESLQRLYRREVQAELARHPPRSPGDLTEQQLEGLPPPVQHHFRTCGFVDRPHAVNLRLHWAEMALRRSPAAGWMQVTCEQLNAVPEPVRLVLMRGRLAGLLPFEGRDKFQDGHGHMLVRVGHVLTVADARGPHMDVSALVTVLAEALLAPAYALQPYATWEPVDAQRAQARFTFGGLSVRGIFHFADAGLCSHFYTEDRWQDGRPPRRLPWSAQLGAYRRSADGILFPTELRGTWHEPGGDFTYARGRIAGITYNVRE